MSAASLRAESVGMRFEGLNAIDGITLEIPAGEIHGLIGPNGAGKTTFFNCVTGFYHPTSGALYLDNVRIDGLPPHRASELGVSRTFQNIRLFSNMTAIENVLVGSHRAAGAMARGERPKDGGGVARRLAPLTLFPRTAALSVIELGQAVVRPKGFRTQQQTEEARSLTLLEAVGLAGRENEIAGSLPYGDQRRLELARAMATEPRLLLLDEPTAGMNPQESQLMVALIRRIRDEFDTTIILIEHQMRVIMGLCERITVMDQGRKISEGSPEAVRHDPVVIGAYLGTRDAGGAHGTA